MMAFLSIGIYAQNKALVVLKDDGEKDYFKLEESPVTSFNDDKIIITTSTVSIEYAQDPTLHFTYEDVATDVSEKSISQQIIQRGNTFYIVCDSDVSLFNVGGVLLDKYPNTGKHIVISFEEKPKGIYVIKFGKKSLKVIRK